MDIDMRATKIVVIAALLSVAALTACGKGGSAAGSTGGPAGTAGNSSPTRNVNATAVEQIRDWANHGALVGYLGLRVYGLAGGLSGATGNSTNLAAYCQKAKGFAEQLVYLADELPPEIGDPARESAQHLVNAYTACENGDPSTSSTVNAELDRAAEGTHAAAAAKVRLTGLPGAVLDHIPGIVVPSTAELYRQLGIDPGHPCFLPGVESTCMDNSTPVPTNNGYVTNGGEPDPTEGYGTSSSPPGGYVEGD